MAEIMIDQERLLRRLQELGQVGRDERGRLARLAATDADREGRDLLVGWIREAGLELIVDRIGNIFGLWRPDGAEGAPIMLGSHIDGVVNAGIYDGCYGVLAGLEVVEALKRGGAPGRRPIIVAAFTNEEGARFTPDMMGSLVYAGGLSLEAALAANAPDGATLGDELERIGYRGAVQPGFVTPALYLELHIEQGPVLEREGLEIGVVENLQGISWQEIRVAGTANHAGTTPMLMRADAGLGAAAIAVFVNELANRFGDSARATVGCIAFEPNVINVIPSRARLSVDLRHPDRGQLEHMEAELGRFLEQLGAKHGTRIETELLSRFDPVQFDQDLCELLDRKATARGFTNRRMTSGAGHDAQMMARICPAAMIFVPSRGGISHNPREYTGPDALAKGATLLLDAVRELAER